MADKDGSLTTPIKPSHPRPQKPTLKDPDASEKRANIASTKATGGIQPRPRRRYRNDPRYRKIDQEPPVAAIAATSTPVEQAHEPQLPAPQAGAGVPVVRRRRPRRRGSAAPAPANSEVATPTKTPNASAPLPKPKPKFDTPSQHRRPLRQRTEPAVAIEKKPSPGTSATALAPAPPQEPGGPRFVGPGEAEFAGILDFYGITWEYEPRTFPLRWEHGRVAEAFSPDFFLPDLNIYVEVTTLKTGLTAEKNRKVRMVKQLYPEVNIRLLKKRDLLRLLTKFGYGPLAPEEVPDVDRILINTPHLQKRVEELGATISRDYAGKDIVLVGVLRGVLCFMADLIRSISLSTSVDFLAVSDFEGATAIKILKDLDENIKGREVILVEDIVDTGMTLNHIVDYLWAKKPASLKICTLLDKRVRRLVNVELAYVGFEVPDEFLVGYGLDFRQRYRNLPFVAVLKHELLP